jgi:hypothetical protein
MAASFGLVAIPVMFLRVYAPAEYVASVILCCVRFFFFPFL